MKAEFTVTMPRWRVWIARQVTRVCVAIMKGCLWVVAAVSRFAVVVPGARRP